MALFSCTVQNSIPILRVLVKTENSKYFSQLIKSKALLNAVTEICHNLIIDFIPIGKKQKELLKSKEATLIVLASKRDKHKLQLLAKSEGQRVLKQVLRATLPIISRSKNGCRKTASVRSKKSGGFRR